MARVLCLHGLGGMGATMWPLVAALGSAGHTVLAPTLPGHGSEPEDLLEVGWDDWLAAALDWPADVVIGQSMGASLALAVAAAGACSKVVAINPLAPDPDAVEGLAWRQSRGHDWVDSPPLEEGEFGYQRLPLSALLSMACGVAAVDLSAARVPALIVTSAGDEVVDPANSDLVAAGVVGPVRRLTLPTSGHVATLGADRSLLCDSIVAFIATRFC